MYVINIRTEGDACEAESHFCILRAFFFCFAFTMSSQPTSTTSGNISPPPTSTNVKKASREALSNADQNTDASKKSGAKTNSPKSIGEIGNARMDVGVSCFFFCLLFLLITFS